MKRVAALYRVSTKKQVDITKDDIPMQRIACRDFAEKQGWTIVKELEEKGVSGYKTHAADRDAIQHLKECAENKEFDVLLVYMFDRLGRIESETPFVVKWFAEHNVEIWSVNEGQQKFDSHSDNLINYIRYWQAEGESQKTSMRVKTRLGQMTAEGIYTGGPVPFGYKLIDNGRKNKKGKPALDLQIDEALVDKVRTLFTMAVDEGYGTHQLAEWLNRQGCRTSTGSYFHASNVHRILKSEIYRGYFVKGDVRSERIPELQIIPDRIYLRAQEILEQRAEKDQEKRNVCMSKKGKNLLGGNLFCAHCGCHLVGSRRKEHYLVKGGIVKEREYGFYECYHKARKLNNCDGPATYIGNRVDECVIDMVHELFSHIGGCPEEEKIQMAYRQAIAAGVAEKQTLKDQFAKDERQLETLRAEIAKALTGDSSFSSEDLSTAIQTVKARMAENEERLKTLEDEENEKKTISENIIPAYRRFRTWALEFDEASLESKKMIISELFSRIELGRDYKIHFVVNFTYKQFCTEWASGTDTANLANS